MYDSNSHISISSSSSSIPFICTVVHTLIREDFAFLYRIKLYSPKPQTILPKTSIRKTLAFYTGSNCTRSSRKPLTIDSKPQTIDFKPQTIDYQLWYHLLEESEAKTMGRSHKNENWVKPYKRIMTLPSIQNFKTLDLRAFFLYIVQLSHFYPI